MEIVISLSSVSHAHVPWESTEKCKTGHSRFSCLLTGCSSSELTQPIGHGLGEFFSHLLVITIFTLLNVTSVVMFPVSWFCFFFPQLTEKPWLWVPKRLYSIFLNKIIFRYSFKGFFNKFLKILLKDCDRGRQHIDHETEWEILLSGCGFFSATNNLLVLKGV